MGALARSLSPHQAKRREHDREGRQAEIQDLERGGFGRVRSRQRRIHRAAQQRNMYIILLILESYLMIP